MFLLFPVPTVEIARSHLVVEEDIGEIKIPLRRTGDTSQRLYVSCVTIFFAEEEGMTGSDQCKTSFKIKRSRSFRVCALSFSIHELFCDTFTNVTVIICGIFAAHTPI